MVVPGILEGELGDAPARLLGDELDALHDAVHDLEDRWSRPLQRPRPRWAPDRVAGGAPPQHVQVSAGLLWAQLYAAGVRRPPPRRGRLSRTLERACGAALPCKRRACPQARAPFLPHPVSAAGQRPGTRTDAQLGTQTPAQCTGSSPTKDERDPNAHTTCSIPLYSPSVFSRMVTISTSW